MKPSRRAWRVPLKGAVPAAWPSQFRGTPGFGHAVPDAPMLSVARVRCAISGVLRVQATGQRRLAAAAGRLP